MTNDKKAAQGDTRTASKNISSNSHSTPTTDPLRGWFDLAKPSRDRRQKKAWQRKKGGV